MSKSFSTLLAFIYDAMDDPLSYQNLNKLMRIKIKNILNNYLTKCEWRRDGTDSLLDIGCGPGDITVEIILPILPSNFKRLVAVDISTKMIEHARKQHQHQKVSFEQLDIGLILEEQEFVTNQQQQFDHITSFYVLHYNVKNLDVAFKNMWKLLKPGGDMCLLHIAQSYSFSVYRSLYKNKKWTNYMFDIDNNVPAHEDVKRQINEFKQLVKEAGFSTVEIKAITEDYIRGSKEYKEFYKSVNPFIYRIPVEKQDEYMEDFYRDAIAMGCAIDDERTSDRRLNNQHIEFIIYAKK